MEFLSWVVLNFDFFLKERNYQCNLDTFFGKKNEIENVKNITLKKVVKRLIHAARFQKVIYYNTKYSHSKMKNLIGPRSKLHNRI